MLDLQEKAGMVGKTAEGEPMEELKRRLTSLSQKIRELKVPVVVVLEGWGAAGKGTLMANLISELDPRGYKVYSVTPATKEEKRYAWMRRYWLRVPQYGRMSFFDQSWYQEIADALLADQVSEKERRTRIGDILDFERQLIADGYVLAKFFLHIGKKEQRKRFERLEARKATRWRVTKADLKQNENYDKCCRIFDRLLDDTHQPGAEWTVLNASDEGDMTRRAYETLIAAVEEAVARKEAAGSLPEAAGAPAGRDEEALPIPRLREVDLSPTLMRDEYEKQLKECQERLAMLHNKLYLKKVPVILAYEGWDAAGKGGNIKRLARGLDPRGYEVVPIAAPSQVEKEHPFLWRFWESLPKDGHIAVFDRSWYGRVMVERIEGFCSEEEWMRAYGEINRFEMQLHDWGAVVHKFWLHIDKDVQLQRFQERENTPEKQYKITQEDWRNREKWDAYETAVDEMLQKTNTAYAPWTIVESNDKCFARIKVLKTVIRIIEERL